MNIVIAGAGELGQLLAEKLTANDHDVVLIDSSVEALDHISGSLEVKQIEGSCIDLETLKRANIRTADVLLAMSGDDATNVLTCQIASRLGVKKTICRLNSVSFFSREDNLQPETFGIWKYVSPPDECVRKIAAILTDRYLLEEIRFSHPDAVMRVFKISPSSQLVNARVQDLPMSMVLPESESVRFAAIVRKDQFVVPNGGTMFVPGDKVYIAGTSDNVAAFIRWASTNQETSKASRVVIAGSSAISTLLGQTLCDAGYDVRFIVKDSHAGNKLFEAIPQNILVVNGNATDEEILREAGADDCDAYISTGIDDEDSILSCILAKQLGARKTVSVTTKPEYIRIVPTMDRIDCGISSSLVAVNSILRMIETGTMRVDAYLQMHHAQLTEFRISNSSPLCGKSLANCRLPPSTVFALLFRNDKVIAPVGSTVFMPGDIVVSIVTPEMKKELAPFFPDR
jgi:trk system potassium uptake protein TrkA